MKKSMPKQNNTKKNASGVSLSNASRFYAFTFFIFLFSFTLVSLVSYSPLDSCLSVANSSYKVDNWGGYYGAILADILLQFFGLGAYCLVFALFFWVLYLLIFNKKMQFYIRIPAATVMLISISSILGFLTKYNFAMQMLPGGYVGHYFANLGIIHLGKPISIVCYVFLFLFTMLLAVYSPASQQQKNGNAIAFVINSFVGVGSSSLASTYNVLRMIAIFPLLLKTIISQVFSYFFIKNTNSSGKKQSNIVSAVNSVSKNSITKSPLKEEPQESEVNLNTLQKIPEGEYKMPTDLLKDHNNDKNTISLDAQEKRKAELLSVLNDFGVKGEILSYLVGPVVTMYELKAEPGTKASRVISLSSDVARALKVPNVRIADVPSRGIIGIELPNEKREQIGIKQILESNTYQQNKSSIPVIFGKDIKGDPIIEDLTKMPHLLIAGATGSGKSVGLNGMILSILYKMSPEDCKFIMIDPKMLELSPYDGIPHLLHPVITDPNKSIIALKWVVSEMINRYSMMSSIGVRNITGYNQKASIALGRGAKIVREIETGYDPATRRIITEQIVQEAKLMPYIIVVVDEVADLMMVAGKEVEAQIQRLAQMARAAGIHVIMATQRPSVDVITGTIKSNFPSRVAYHVASKIDSRTILGEQGAEQLLGKGDMLYSDVGKKPQRVHGPFVSDEEVEAVVNYLKSVQSPNYVDITKEVETETNESGTKPNASGGKPNGNTEYADALDIIQTEGKTSISYIQRRLGIGYNKAANIIEKMETEGILSAPDRTGKRTLIKN